MATPCSLTLGVFDGVHLGHQHLLRALTHKRVVFTFSNHPLTVLSGVTPPLLMCAHHRMDLLRNFADEVIASPFDPQLAKLSPETFIRQLKKHISFTHLVLGHDAVFGHERAGSPDLLRKLSQHMQFSLSYVQPFQLNGEIVSSRLIREYLLHGKLDHVATLLGRPYSIRGIVTEGQHLGQILGFPTANLSIGELALPPPGVYSVRAKQTTPHHPYWKAIANLGHAPTIHTNRSLLLEVHILDPCPPNLYGQEIEVEFISFLRNEKKFSSMEQLMLQIQQDVKYRLSMQK